MKKILYMFLIVCTIISVQAKENPYYTNSNGISMTEQEYNNLLQLGFTEKQITKMNSSTFLDNKDISATLVGENKQYYRSITYMRNGIEFHTSEVVTEEEMQQLRQKSKEQLRSPSGNYYTGLVADDYLAVTTRISNISDNYMRYKLDVNWFDPPSMRSYDIYGIGIENSKVQVASEVYCEQSWDYTNGSSDYSEGCYPKISSTGGAAMFKLPTGSLDTLDTYIYFDIAKLPGVGTITSLQAVGDHAHAIHTSSDEVRNYYVINLGGFTVYSPYTTYYDLIDSPGAAGFAGTW